MRRWRNSASELRKKGGTDGVRKREKTRAGRGGGLEGRAGR